MSPSRIVFHCTDQDLFDLFIGRLSRQVLIDPLRNDQDIHTRYFRGYRITKSSPDVAAISRAYYKEINVQHNTELMNYLHNNWILAHAELATSTLEQLGMSNIDLGQSADWLSQAHGKLKDKGHLDTAAEITRVLAFDYPVEDILTMLSILSVDFEQQSELRQCIEREFQTVHDDPGHLHAALVKQQTHLRGKLDAIQQRRSEETTRCEAELRPVENELTKLAKKRDKFTRERHSEEQTLKQRKDQLDKAQAEYDAAKARMQEWKSKQTKIESSIANRTQKLQQRKYSRDALFADLEKQKLSLESELSDIAERLEAAKKRKEAAIMDSTARVQNVKSPGNSSCELEDILAFVNRPGFFASSVTLDILGMSLQGKLPPTDAPPRQTDYVADPKASALYYAHMAVYGQQPWAGEVLGRYALAKSVYGAEDNMDLSEYGIEILLGGLHHVEHTVVSELVDRLLARLIELLQGGEGSLDLSENLERLQGCFSPALLRRLGAIQAKLATANPQALQRLYDSMPAGVRVHAKRALVAQVRELRLQDTDPTHEVLDVVTTHLESLVGQLASGSQTWGEQATLGNDVKQRRQSLLANAAKLAHVFSPATNIRLTHFRDLLGPRLTQVLATDTLDEYAAFRRLLLEYCLRNCYQPEWISGRYLFPIVIALSHVASRADHAVRQRKAELKIALEKQQHPLKTVRRGVPLRISLENSGVATASAVEVEIEADHGQVAVRPRHWKVAKIVPEELVWYEASMDIGCAVSAVELSCLFHWKDPSGVQRVREETLKMSAQRDVDWAKARVNPYSLRSITSEDRLVGRDGDLGALRMGIEGAQSFCITGQKRVGKSSIAKVLFREFQESGDHVSVYVTYGELEATSWPVLVHSLYEAINAELEDVVEGGRAELPAVEEFVSNQAKCNRQFLRDLRRRLNGKRVLCIVDDFDEIDERMYKGGGKELFLRLRTLIDGGDFSFVLVGSEKLSDVFKHQGERLNQVDRHSLNYFRDRASLERLVAEPARPHLDWSDEAIDEIWRYSAGNPYYATQVCVKVYGDMVGRRDHYVGRSDVERNVDGICRDSGMSTFQHFWTDGVFEGGLDTARLKYLNAAILSVCARCCKGGAEDGVERATLLADKALRSYDPAQVQFRLDNLVDRGVLLERAGRVRLRVPLFERWLVEGGEAAVRSSFSKEDLEVRLAPTVSGVAPRRIVEITQDLHYQGRPVSEDRVRAWLEQFGPAENQRLALRLLERLKTRGYYDEARVHSQYKVLDRMMSQEFASGGEFAKRVERGRVKNVFVAHFNVAGRSGARILHDYRTANSVANSLVGSMEQAVEFVVEQRKRGRECGVVFVDDFIGTGGSCVAGLRKFQGRLAVEEKQGKVLVGVAAIVGLKAGVESVRKNGVIDCYVVTSDELGVEGRAFAPEAKVFGEEGDRIAAETLCRDIGEVLEPKQPLGFGDSQALVCFHYRCPNNTLPVFYKDEVVYQGRKWIALFPR